MKTTLSILVLALTATVLPTYADPTDAATQKPDACPKFQFGQLTVDFPQTGAAGEPGWTTTGVSYCTKTGVETITGNGKMIVTAPGQKPITISGENLTLTWHN